MAGENKGLYIMLKKNEQQFRYDNIKWFLIITLLIGGLLLNQQYIERPITLRLIGWVILTCIEIFIIYSTSAGRKFWHFFDEAKEEIKKVVWPKRNETFQTTLLILAVVFVFSFIFWGVDSLLMWVISFFTGQGS
jgi:preprotein translocase subunit SecE